ncbi:MAG: aminotransferase class IV [Planctomycetota bacterium]|nr:aminotransferase class IV [Planctomycetota bacterium]
MIYSVSINGVLTDPKQASVSIFDHGFLFGDSVYEVVRTIHGRIFAFEPHIDRLFSSAQQIGLEIPWSREDLRKDVVALLKHSQLEEEAYVRLILTRGVGELNIDPSSCRAPQIILIAKALPRLPASAYTDGIVLSLVNTKRNSKHATNPGIKSGNYLNNVLALMEARKNKALEAVMLNENGFITECTTSNVFLVKDSKILTPSLECGLLAGVTRKLVLSRARAEGLTVEEGFFKPEDLVAVDEAFITSTTRDVVPVSRIDDRSLGVVPGPVTKRVAALYQDEVKKHLDKDCPLPHLAEKTQ